MNTTNLLIKVTHHSDISQPEYLKHDNSFVITSPVKIKLKPRSDAWIDLKFNIEITESVHRHSIWLKPSTVFGCLGFDIADKETWVMNKTKRNTIALHVFNNSFYYEIEIKKDDILGFGFLLENVDSSNLDIRYKIINN